MERTQFTFYDSFFKAISRIKKKADRADAYDAICAYALYGEEPDLETMSDSAAIAFELSKPNLDASRRKAQNGSKGGSARQTESKSEANDKQTESKNKKEDKKKNKNKNKCYSAADFEQFWSAYPRKVGKQKAQEAFEKINVPLETLLSALEEQKRTPQWAKDGGQFIPHPATWLNQSRWEDEVGSHWTPQERELSQDEIDAIKRMMEEFT